MRVRYAGRTGRGNFGPFHAKHIKKVKQWLCLSDMATVWNYRLKFRLGDALIQLKVKLEYVLQCFCHDDEMSTKTLELPALKIAISTRVETLRKPNKQVLPTDLLSLRCDLMQCSDVRPISLVTTFQDVCAHSLKL